MVISVSEWFLFHQAVSITKPSLALAKMSRFSTHSVLLMIIERVNYAHVEVFFYFLDFVLITPIHY